MLRKLVLMLFALIFSVAMVACGDIDESENTEESDDETTESAEVESDDAEESEEVEEEPAEEEESSETLTVGDTAEVDGVEFTLVNVTTTDERNEFAETDPTHVVEIEYTIVNNTDGEISVGMDLDVYDGNGSQAESYPLENTMGSLQPGKNIQGFEYFGVEEGPIEIYFAPLISFEDPAIFEAEIE